MFVDPDDQAISVLKNRELAYHRREVAVHHIAQHPTLSGIQALVDALRDEDFAIRWIASVALAQLGSIALPEVLRSLTNPAKNTARMREGVIHILHYSSNLANTPVYQQQQVEPEVSINSRKKLSVSDLMDALKGPAADLKSIKVAGKLLDQMESELAHHK